MRTEHLYHDTNGLLNRQPRRRKPSAVNWYAIGFLAVFAALWAGIGGAITLAVWLWIR